MKKTGNKWSTNSCPSCGWAHYNYSGKLDSDGKEYVICGSTQKKCNTLTEYPYWYKVDDFVLVVDSLACMNELGAPSNVH